MVAESNTDEDQKRAIFVFLKLFHLFTHVIKCENKGNTDLVQSILRDYSKSWYEFYEAVLPYFKKFTNVLKAADGLRITHETMEKGGNAIRIEFTDAWMRDDPGQNEKRMAVNANLSDIYDSSKTSHPRKSLPELLPYATKSAFDAGKIFNYFLPSFFQLNANYQSRSSRKPKLLAIEAVPGKPISENRAHQGSTEIFDQDHVSDAEEVDESFEKVPEKVNELASPSNPSFLDNFFMEMEHSKPEEPKNSNKEEDTAVAKMATEIEKETYISAFKDKTEILRNELTSKESEVNGGIQNLMQSGHVEEHENKNEGNEEFEKILEEQKRRNEEELEEKRQERTEKQRIMEEEFKDLRRQQKLKFCVLLRCIQLRQRFEEKQEEWADWIENGFRRPIAVLINQFANFQEELGLTPKQFSKLLETSPETIRSEVSDFEGKLQLSLNNVSRVFNTLSKIGDDFEDTIFIRILQKSSCEIAMKIINVLELMSTIEYSKEWYEKIYETFGKIHTSDVPGVQKLKLISRDCDKGDFKNLEFPKWKYKNHVKIEELSSDEEEEKNDLSAVGLDHTCLNRSEEDMELSGVSPVHNEIVGAIKMQDLDSTFDNSLVEEEYESGTDVYTYDEKQANAVGLVEFIANETIDEGIIPTNEVQSTSLGDIREADPDNFDLNDSQIETNQYIIGHFREGDAKNLAQTYSMNNEEGEVEIVNNYKLSGEDDHINHCCEHTVLIDITAAADDHGYDKVEIRAIIEEMIAKVVFEDIKINYLTGKETGDDSSVASDDQIFDEKEVKVVIEAMIAEVDSRDESVSTKHKTEEHMIHGETENFECTTENGINSTPEVKKYKEDAGERTSTQREQRSSYEEKLIIQENLRHLTESLGVLNSRRKPSSTSDRPSDSEVSKSLPSQSRSKHCTDPDTSKGSRLPWRVQNYSRIRISSTANSFSSHNSEDGTLYTVEKRNSSYLRFELLRLYKYLVDSDEPRFKFEEGRNLMKIDNKGKNNDIVKIWNRIVEDTTTFLEYESFARLVDFKLPEIMEDSTSQVQVTDC